MHQIRFPLDASEMTYIVSGGALNSTQTKSGAPPQTPWGYAPDASGELTALPQTSHLYLREPKKNAKGAWTKVREVLRGARNDNSHQVDGLTAEVLNKHYAESDRLRLSSTQV